MSVKISKETLTSNSSSWVLQLKPAANELFERSSVWSFSNLPIVSGIGQEIALFCNNLHHKP